METKDEIVQQQPQFLSLASGFRDFNAEEMKLRNECLDKIRRIFISHNGEEIETPAFEKREILAEKYGTESKKEVFNLEDVPNEAQLTARYDLTIPFCRFMATNNILSMRRFQIAKVWRRDNPSVVKSRYREFMQADMDIAGETRLMLADAEVIRIMYENLSVLLQDVLSNKSGNFCIKINHRKLLYGLLEFLHVPKDKITSVCTSIDKLDKFSWDIIQLEIIDKGIDKDIVTKIGELMIISGDCEKVLDLLVSRDDLKESIPIQESLSELKVLFDYLKIFKCIDKCVFSLNLARGLEYYTGLIFESLYQEIEDKDNPILNSIGSVGGGGRFDNLIGCYRPDKRKIPVVGCSVGFERIFSILKEKQKSRFLNTRQSQANVLLHCTDEKSFPVALEILHELWSATSTNIIPELRYELGLKFKDQNEYCLDNKIPYMLIIGGTELKTNQVTIKFLKSKKEMKLIKNKSEAQILIDKTTIVKKLSDLLYKDKETTDKEPTVPLTSL